jgi:hypothetical protein
MPPAAVPCIKKEMVMEETAPARENRGDEQKPEIEESPSEKLEGTPPPGSLIPGTENPESEEIKKEENPNTE